MLTTRHSKKLLFTLISLFFTASAMAEQTSPWSGPYIGAYLGAGIGNNKVSTNVGGVSDTSYFTTTADVNAVNNAGSYNKNPSAMIAGIQFGQDWAYKKMVYGVVFDFSSLSLNSSQHSNATYPDSTDQYSLSTSMKTNWLLTLRARLGYQVKLHWPALLYATGGMAITRLQVENDFSDTSALSGVGSSQTANNQIGWTLGAGLEFALKPHVSAMLEYDYVDVPSVKTTGLIYNSAAGFGPSLHSLTNTFATTGQFHANLIKIGLNYRF